jgi:hypothetical protein
LSWLTIGTATGSSRERTGQSDDSRIHFFSFEVLAFLRNIQATSFLNVSSRGNVPSRRRFAARFRSLAKDRFERDRHA